MIEVELPDGTVAEFPDGTPPEAIKRAIQRRFPPTQGSARVGLAAGAPAMPEAQPGYLADMIQSGAAGLRQGAEGMAGMWGDAAQRQGDVLGWAAGRMGAGEAGQDAARTAGRFLHPAGILPTTDDIRRVTDPVIGESYEPQTMAGEYARTVGQFAPTVALGPGSAGRKVATGLSSALASESAGQLTKGSEAEPYARFLGAFAGGVAGSRIGFPSRRPQLPSAAEIKGSAGYAALKPEMQRATVNREAYSNIVRDLKAAADDFGMVPEQHSAFQRILARHATLARKGGATLQDLEILRRSLANAGQSTTNRSASALSRRLVDTLDEAVNAVDGSGLQVSTGRTISDTLGDLQSARETWRTGMKAEMMEAATERARNTASGFENGLRIEFRKILNNKTLSRMFSDVEKQAMRQVVRGTFKGNLLRWLGGFGVPLDQGRNFLGSVMGGGAGSAVGALIGGPIGAAIGGPSLVALGTAAKAGSNAITRNSALFTEALVKAGPAGRRIMQDALLEFRAARNLGLIRSGVHANQALQSSLDGGQKRLIRSVTP